MTVQLIESVASLPAPSAPGKYRIRLIGSDIQGSSGFYPKEMLARDGVGAFPKNTKIYANHPSLDEEINRPERDVEKIAGYLLTDPVMESDGLYADVQFVGKYKEAISEIHHIIGMSINAQGERESRTIGGSEVLEVTKLIPSPMNSCDLVTVAGANGAIIEALTESLKNSAPAVEDKNNRKEIMEIEDVKLVVSEGFKEFGDKLTALLAPITESLKPKETAPADVADAIEVATEKAIEAKLPKLLRKAVIEQVKANPEADVDKLVTEAKSFRDEVVTESGDTTSTGNVREAAGKGESVGSLSLFGKVK